MQTSYIYSVSRANTLSQFLLSKTDIERLLVAEPGDDLQSALKETYLAPYVERVSGGDISLAIEQTLIEAKRMIHKIAPQGDLFRVLWLQYDIHNLRIFTKAITADLAPDRYAADLSKRGVFTPEHLKKHIDEKTLNNLYPGWQKTFDQAVTSAAEGDISQIDGLYDALYFDTSKLIVKEGDNQFMSCYLKILIDLYNLKSRLRHLENKVIGFTPDFIRGGSFAKDQIETFEDVRTVFARFGGEGHWREALEVYATDGSFIQIDARSAEYLMQVTKENSNDMFSSASLVLYYLKCRQAAANVRAIVVGKNSGLENDVIRHNLRLAYVND